MMIPVKDSQFYTDINMLIATIRNVKIDASMTTQKDLDYIIKGLENTLDKGYNIYSNQDVI